jgi:hypothetical protein
VALQKLDLGSNKLSGELFHLTMMATDHNRPVFAGPIPDFSLNTALKYLYLQNNELTGKSTTITSDRTT